ncbi:MAG: hypothetical protein QUS14_06710 [Pyrinomonadaceae bacterium]|nr:hypothetical protein [Pyrinomonadaceae bacterium]
MAVNENVLGRPVAVVDAAERRAREHRFYLVAGFLATALVFIGFSKQFYLRLLFDLPPLYSNMVRFHAVVMTAWVLLFAAQTWLVSAKRIRTHMKLGWAGVGLAVLVLVTGYLVSIGGPSHLTAADLGGIPPLSFMIIPLVDLLLFILFFGGAIVLRKQPAEHKRLMILVAANFLPPAAARMPIESLQALGPWWLFGMPSLFVIGAVVFDIWRSGKVNLNFLAGTVILVASFPIRLWIGGTETWTNIARWLSS